MQDIQAALQKLETLLPIMRRDLGFELFFDTRERVQVLKDLLGSISKVKTLPAGDVWIVLYGKLLFVIERKSTVDLSSSVDGRTPMQKFKLKSLPIPDSRLVYLIEKSPTSSQAFQLDRNSIVGAQSNMIVLDHMNVWNTDGPLDTVFWFLKLVGKIYEHASTWKEELAGMPRYETAFEEAAPATTTGGDDKTARDVQAEHRVLLDKAKYEREYVAARCKAAAVRKTVTSTQRTVFAQQLCAVKGITVTKALIIAGAYPSWLDLAALAKSDKDGKKFVKALSTLRVPTSQKTIEKRKVQQMADSAKDEDDSERPKKKKRAASDSQNLGKAVAQRLYEMTVPASAAKTDEQSDDDE